MKNEIGFAFLWLCFISLSIVALDSITFKIVEDATLLHVSLISAIIGLLLVGREEG